MTFAHPWLLPLAVIPLLWLAWRRAETRRKLAFTLKALALAAILAAVAQPVLIINSSRVAVAVLADTSRSIPSAGLERESRLVRQMDRARGRNLLRVIAFARQPSPASDARRIVFTHPPGSAANATDIEAAVRAAIATAPRGYAPRIVLLSDGRENEGSAARAAWLARDLAIPIDTYQLAGRPRPRLSLDAISLPGNAYSGERFPVDLTVTAPEPTRAEVDIRADGKPLGSQSINLRAGSNTLRLHVAVQSSGALTLSGAIRASDLGDAGEAAFEQAITLRRPKVLFVNQDPEGAETHLLQTLAASQFDVTQVSSLPAGPLDSWQVIVLNNINLSTIPEPNKDAIEQAAKRGAGLLLIGGERETYVEKKTEDALDRVLPARIAPPRSPEGTCVVLIIDKSSSMEGKKIELARLASIGVVDNLRPVDKVGVLIFDNSFLWAVPLRPASDRTLISRLIAGIVPDGGTQIAPALAEAYRKILREHATFKHIVLLTDGISEEGDSLDVAKQAQAQHVTISTVGLGQDVNRSYLERIAELAGGKSYFLSEPAGLQQILLRDVKEHTGSTAVEKDLKPEVRSQTSILDGIDIGHAPALKGYVRFEAKPTAETILAIGENDPLLVRWQAGLGRTAVFTSDAKSRWASAWVAWPGFDRFWANLFHDLLPHTAPQAALAGYDAANGVLTAEYHLSENTTAPVKPPAVYVLGPDGFEQPLPLTQTGPASYSGEVAIGDRRGLFRIRPQEESTEFPEIGLYREEQEQREYGSNPGLLRGLSRFTGGRFEPSIAQVFDPAGRTYRSDLRCWPGLIALALLLNLTELILRKFPGIAATLRGH